MPAASMQSPFTVATGVRVVNSFYRLLSNCPMQIHRRLLSSLTFPSRSTQVWALTDVSLISIAVQTATSARLVRIRLFSPTPPSAVHARRSARESRSLCDTPIGSIAVPHMVLPLCLAALTSSSDPAIDTHVGITSVELCLSSVLVSLFMSWISRSTLFDRIGPRDKIFADHQRKYCACRVGQASHSYHSVNNIEQQNDYIFICDFLELEWKCLRIFSPNSKAQALYVCMYGVQLAYIP